MSINYLDIIKKAWSITWQNKYLWWFGLFIALTSASGYSNYNFPGSDEKTSILQEKILNFAEQNLAIIISVGIILLIVLIVLAVLGLLGRGALIKSIHATTKQEPSNFKLGWDAGKKYFWKLFVLGLALGLFILAVLIVLLVPIIFLFVSKSYILGTILAIVGFFLFVPLAILTSYLKTYGQLYLVLGDIKLWPAIENAYALFLKNLGASIIMSLIFIVFGLLFGLAIILALIPIGIFFAILGFVSHLIFKTVGVAIIIGLGILIASILLLAARSVYETFAQAVWVLFFHEIAKPKVAETITEAATEKIPDPIATPDPITFSEK